MANGSVTDPLTKL